MLFFPFASSLFGLIKLSTAALDWSFLLGGKPCEMLGTGAWYLTSFINLNKFELWHLMLGHQPTDVCKNYKITSLILQGLVGDVKNFCFHTRIFSINT